MIRVLAAVVVLDHPAGKAIAFHQLDKLRRCGERGLRRIEHPVPQRVLWIEQLAIGQLRLCLGIVPIANLFAGDPRAIGKHGAIAFRQAHSSAALPEAKSQQM